MPGECFFSFTRVLPTPRKIITTVFLPQSLICPRALSPCTNLLLHLPSKVHFAFYFSTKAKLHLPHLWGRNFLSPSLYFFTPLCLFVARTIDSPSFKCMTRGRQFNWKCLLVSRGGEFKSHGRDNNLSFTFGDASLSRASSSRAFCNCDGAIGANYG